MTSDKLPKTGFLSEASDALIDMLEAVSVESKLASGEVLFEQGDQARALYALIDGTLEVSVLSMDGRKLALNVMRPGALFGEIALFDPGERTATISALEPCILRRVRYDDVLAKVREEPDLAIDLIQLAGQRMRWMDRQLNEQVFLPLPTRLARKILYLTDRPADAKWLTLEERTWLMKSMADEEKELGDAGHQSAGKTLRDPRVIGFGLVYFGITYGLYALSFFLPSIVAGFKQTFNTDFSLVETGLIVAVPYAIGAVAMVLWSRHSDKTGERMWHVAAPTLLGAVSIPIALYLDSPFTVMIAVSLTAVGVLCALPVFWYLPTTFLTGASAAAGIAMINSIGNASGFGAPYITGWLTDVTGNAKAGLWVVGAVMLCAAILVVALAKRSSKPAQI